MNIDTTATIILNDTDEAWDLIANGYVNPNRHWFWNTAHDLGEGNVAKAEFDKFEEPFNTSDGWWPDSIADLLREELSDAAHPADIDWDGSEIDLDEIAVAACDAAEELEAEEDEAA